jgi:hypothetical protein
LPRCRVYQFQKVDEVVDAASFTRRKDVAQWLEKGKALLSKGAGSFTPASDSKTKPASRATCGAWQIAGLTRDKSSDSYYKRSKVVPRRHSTPHR